MFGKSTTEPLERLRVGCKFEVYGTDWEIVAIGEYDWKMDGSSVEYTLSSKGKEAYLEVEIYKGAYEVYFSKAISMDQGDIEEGLEREELYFNGKTYELDEVYEGDFRNLTARLARENLKCFQFYKGDEFVTVELWSDGSFETFLGEEIKAKKIKNLRYE